jgi:hypothetical protein
MWQSIEALPIAVDTPIEPTRAAAVRDALLARVVPIAGLVDGRPEPRGTGALLRYGREVWLVTAAHVLDGVAVGDLAVPSRPGSGVWVTLSRCRTRVLAHPHGDVALISVADSAALRGWIAIDGHSLLSPPHRAVQHVIAGYPYAQMRRVDGVLYARPIVVFTRVIASGTYVYSRLAERVDGVTIHAPPLDGVSGALVWAIQSQNDRTPDCTLVPCGVQVAFRHDAHVRSESIALTRELLAQTVLH